MSWPIVTIDNNDRSSRSFADNNLSSSSSSKKLLSLRTRLTTVTCSTLSIFCKIAPLIILLLISFAILINSSFASPILSSTKDMKNRDILLTLHDIKPPPVQRHRRHNLLPGHILRRVVRSTASAQQQQQPQQACLVQLVERRSCRPISAPVDWDVDIVDDSSATVEPTDSAERRYHEMGFNAPSLRLTPYNNDPQDESTYFIERPVHDKPGVFTLQTLSTREFVCQAPAVKRRCWWIAGKMSFGSYGQQRHAIALISARHYPKIGDKNVTQIISNSKSMVKLSNAASLSSHWVVGFRRDGRPLPAYAPKVISQSQLLQHAGADNIAFDTFLFTRLVASHDVHEAHGFSSNSCSESIQRHNNYARHLVFC